MKSIAFSYVRFSSEKQSKGQSVNRQVQLSRDYANQHGLILDESLNLQDLGVSAFKGKNLEPQSRLGGFLELAKAGKIPQNSYLLVESLDRISRTNILKFQEIFLSILNLGITIVTIADGQIYNAQDIIENPHKLFISLSVMIRANEESKTKSGRIKQARDARRKKAAEQDVKFRIYTPPWCRFEDGKYVVDEAKAKIINNLFHRYVNGHGIYTITKELNADKVPGVNKSGTWYQAWVSALLHDERLLGRSEILNRDDYFPAVVDKELFNRVQLKLNESIKVVGRIGNDIGNLFQGLCFCGHCHHKMTKKSDTIDGYKYEYLICLSKFAAQPCESKRFVFAKLEKSFVHLVGTKFYEFFKQEPSNTQTKLNALEGELVGIRKQIEKLNKLVLSDESPSVTLVRSLKDFERKETDCLKDIQLAKGALANEKQNTVDDGFLEELIRDKGAKLKDPELRKKLRLYIRATVERIVVFTATEFERIEVYRKDGKVFTVVFLPHSKKAKEFSYQIHRPLKRRDFSNTFIVEKRRLVTEPWPNFEQWTHTDTKV